MELWLLSCQNYFWFSLATSSKWRMRKFFFFFKKRHLLVFYNDPDRNKADAANHVQVLCWLHFDSFVIKYNEKPVSSCSHIAAVTNVPLWYNSWMRLQHRQSRISELTNEFNWLLSSNTTLQPNSSAAINRIGGKPIVEHHRNFNNRWHRNKTTEHFTHLSFIDHLGKCHSLVFTWF